jgi:DNA modification methylase
MSHNRISPGLIRDAIIECLRSRSTSASVNDICSSVNVSLRRNVPKSSVRSYLNLNVPDVFLRTAHGYYQLVGSRDEKRRTGQLECKLQFQFRKCTLYLGDCLEWLAGTAERSIHAVVTDPPYGLVEYEEEQQRKLRNGRGGVWRIPPSFDGSKRSPLPRFTTLTPSDVDNLKDFFQKWGRLLRRVLVPGAHVFVASNPLISYAVAGALVEAGLERRGEIIRRVMTLRGGDRPKNAHEEFPSVSVMPRSMWEPWLLFREPIEGRVQDNLRRWKTGALRRPDEDRPFGDVIESSPTRKGERVLAPHPSLKPQAFLRQIVRASLPLGEGVVLDPFAGSGSTLAACESVGYSSVGIEIDKHFATMAIRAIPRLAEVQVSASR